MVGRHGENGNGLELRMGIEELESTWKECRIIKLTKKRLSWNRVS